MPAPSIPQNFYVQQGNGQVYLSWDLMAGVTSYDVQRSLDGITYASVAAPVVNDYLDTTITIGLQYYYKIAAINGVGTGSYTIPQTVVPVIQGQMTLGQIRLLSQQRADRVNSQFVTLPEWNTYINQSYFELYDILTTVFEDYNVAVPFSFQTVGSQQQYDLPTDFYKLMGVDCALTPNQDAYITLHKYDFISRNRYLYPNLSTTPLGVFNLRYRLLGNKLTFIPVPSASMTMRMWYVPRMTQLLKDTDIVDGVSGWTEYIVVDAAIKALLKEESDVTALMVQKQALLDRIQSTAMNRDVGEPDTVSDTRSWSQGWGSGGPEGDGSFGGY